MSERKREKGDYGGRFKELDGELFFLKRLVEGCPIYKWYRMADDEGTLEVCLPEDVQ